MKKKIAILGSTGSIGKCLIDIIKKDRKNFEIILLSADENYKELLKQAKFFNVKNLIITNNKSFNVINKSKYSKKINIYNNFDNFKKIFKKKIDYTMRSISGVQGLKPTIEIIRYTNNIAIIYIRVILIHSSLLYQITIAHYIVQSFLVCFMKFDVFGRFVSSTFGFWGHFFGEIEVWRLTFSRKWVQGRF